MDYQEIMCSFCKECKGIIITKTILNTANAFDGNTVVTKCANFCPKYSFEDKSNDTDYCSFLLDTEEHFE